MYYTQFWNDKNWKRGSPQINIEESVVKLTEGLIWIIILILKDILLIPLFR